MLCLSGFELYSRWVLLIFLIGMRLIKVSTPLSHMRAQVNQKNSGL